MERKVIQKDTITLDDLIQAAQCLPGDTPILLMNSFNGPSKTSEIEIDEFFSSPHMVGDFEYTANDSLERGKGFPCIVLGERK